MICVEYKYISDHSWRIDHQSSHICSIVIAVFWLVWKGLKNVWRWRRIQPRSEPRVGVEMEPLRELITGL